MATFGERLKETRKKNGLSQVELAKILDVHYITVSRWENSALCPGIKILITLSQMFGVTSDYLLGITTNEENEKMNPMETTNRKLYAKLSKEYNDYLDSLKKMPVEDAIQHAYETVFKEEILICVQNGGFSYPHICALLSLESPLDELYSRWLKKDCSQMDYLKECIKERAEIAVHESRLSQNAKER